MKEEMKNKKRAEKKNEKRGIGKIAIIGIFAFALLFGIILISALTTEEQNALLNELNSLENELSDNNYGWLVNYLSEMFIKLNLSIKGDLSL